MTNYNKVFAPPTSNTQKKHDCVEAGCMAKDGSTCARSKMTALKGQKTVAQMEYLVRKFTTNTNQVNMTF